VTMTDDGFTITRIFEAPRERVWSEWTEPERFADWFGGSDGEVPPSTVSMDLRVGGLWKATMYYGPDRRVSHWDGEYREVEPPARLVLTISDQPGSGIYGLLIVDLTDLDGDRTEMHFQQLGPLAREHWEAARSGWGIFFDRMAERPA
jgi:uncharacterized protein YndB with AHSA1/START domain